MANVAHAGLTAANLHEPKGAAAATANQLYLADGAASGTWTTIYGGMNQYVFTIHVQDASSATAALNSSYLAMPFACTVTQVYSVAFAAIATTDNVLTVADHTGDAMGTITVAFTGSAIGDVDTITTITTNNTFAAGEKLSVISNSGSATVCPMTITIIATRTG